MTFDVQSTLIIIIGFQCLLLAILFLVDNQNAIKKYVFAAILFGYFFLLADFGIHFDTQNYAYGPKLYGYRFPIRFLMGPLFLLYVLLLTQKEVNVKKYLSLHFIPACISLLSLMPIFLLNKSELIEVLKNGRDTFNSQYFTLRYLNSIFSLLSNMIYVFIALKVLFQYKRLAPNFHSNNQRIEINTLFNFTALFSFVILIKFLIAVAIALPFYRDMLFDNIYYYAQLVFSISVVLVGVMALLQKELIGVPTGLLDIQQDKNKAKPFKDQKLFEELDTVMVAQELFLNNNLTVKDFSDKMDWPSYKVAAVINQTKGITFSEYVNELRVKRAKHLLIQNQKKDKLFKIAIESGFGNTTNLHRTFKKITGMTPNTYRASSH